MGKLLNKICKPSILLTAWKKICENAYSSPSVETREAAKEFAANSPKNIKKIQTELKTGSFAFDLQRGITIPKANGKKRGIILSSIRNRVVERAILDVLQSDVEFIKKVNSTETSIGGVPERNVPHALKIIDEAFKNRARYNYFARSDISKFFDNINPIHFSNIVKNEFNDDEIVSLICDAMKVNLTNEKILGEDRKLFPSNEHGIPQGSPLSPLIGNVILHEFDHHMNVDGLICIRYIDDFLILGGSRSEVQKGFNKASKWLSDHGFQCADAYGGKCSQKAEQGCIGRNSFVFLGYHCEPGIFQPTKDAKKKLFVKIKQSLYNTNKLHKDEVSYIRALQTVSNIIKGWGNAYSYSTNPKYMKDTDKEIFRIIDDFKKKYWRNFRKISDEDKLRMLGISLLQDIPQKKLRCIPRKPNIILRKWSSKGRIEVSTDGAYRKHKNIGMGAWAVVFHDTSFPPLSGHDPSTTINRMELKAVIEAIRYSNRTLPLEIYSDSTYVCSTINSKNIIKNNFDLWEELEKLSFERKLKFTKIKGHTGCVLNKEADEIATNLARDELKKSTKK